MTEFFYLSQRLLALSCDIFPARLLSIVLEDSHKDFIKEKRSSRIFKSPCFISKSLLLLQYLILRVPIFSCVCLSCSSERWFLVAFLKCIEFCLLISSGCVFFFPDFF